MVSEGENNYSSDYVVKTKYSNVFQGAKRNQKCTNAAVRSKGVVCGCTAPEASFTYIILSLLNKHYQLLASY